MSPTRPAAVVVLAAGEGTRMKSATPKVLHRIGGRSLLGHALAAARALDPSTSSSSCGTSATGSPRTCARSTPTAVVADQDERQRHRPRRRVRRSAPLGRAAPAPWSSPTATCRCSTARRCASCVAAHHAAAAPRVTVAHRARSPTPPATAGSCADAAGDVAAHRRAEGRRRRRSARSARSTPASTPSTPRVLRDALGRIGTDNAQGEEYLTDVLGDRARPTAAGVGAVRDRRRRGRSRASTTACSWPRSAPSSTAASLERLDARRRDGRRPGDAPGSTSTAELAPDVTLLPGTQLHGATVVGAGAVIGPDTTLDRRRGRRRRERRPDPRLADDRRGRERRAVRLPAARHAARRRGQDRRRSSRRRTRRSATGRRCRTCPTSATPTIGEQRTSAPRRSS